MEDLIVAAHVVESNWIQVVGLEHVATLVDVRVWQLGGAGLIRAA